jgi:hypothetical protein
MIKKNKRNLGYIIATLFTGLAACIALADQQNIPCTLRTVGGSGCPGAYTGYAKMTNNVGGFWITPPTNAVSGTLTDASGFPSPYVSVAYVMRKSDLVTWCGTNSVTFPATSSTSYELFVYIKNTPPPPTNGQPMNLQIAWQ